MNGRVWFCAVTALIAAALADPLVESLSNNGAFGGGSFTDHSNADVVPALSAGLMLAALAGVIRLGGALRGAHRATPAAPLGVLRLVPFVFALQIVLLYAMETGEQLAVYGRLLGGALWLGGPPLASLTIHALACVLATWLAVRTARAFARTVVRIAGRIMAIAVAPRTAAVFCARLGQRLDTRRSAFARRVAGERAPPQLAL